MTLEFSRSFSDTSTDLFNCMTIQMEDFLSKRSRNVKVWRTRWVVLQRSKLYTFNLKKRPNKTHARDVTPATDVYGRQHLTECIDLYKYDTFDTSFVVYGIAPIFCADADASKSNITPTMTSSLGSANSSAKLFNDNRRISSSRSISSDPLLFRKFELHPKINFRNEKLPTFKFMARSQCAKRKWMNQLRTYTNFCNEYPTKTVGQAHHINSSSNSLGIASFPVSYDDITNVIHQLIRCHSKITAIWVVSRPVSRRWSSNLQHWIIKIQAELHIVELEFYQHNKHGQIRCRCVFADDDDCKAFLYFLNLRTHVKKEYEILSCVVPKIALYKNNQRFDHSPNIGKNAETDSGSVSTTKSSKYNLNDYDSNHTHNNSHSHSHSHHNCNDNEVNHPESASNSNTVVSNSNASASRASHEMRDSESRSFSQNNIVSTNEYLQMLHKSNNNHKQSTESTTVSTTMASPSSNSKSNSNFISNFKPRFSSQHNTNSLSIISVSTKSNPRHSKQKPLPIIFSNDDDHNHNNNSNHGHNIMIQPNFGDTHSSSLSSSESALNAQAVRWMERRDRELPFKSWIYQKRVSELRALKRKNKQRAKRRRPPNMYKSDKHDSIALHYGIECSKKVCDIADFVNDWTQRHGGYSTLKSNCQTFALDLFEFCIGQQHPGKVIQLRKRIQNPFHKK